MPTAESHAHLVAAARHLVQWGRTRQGAWHDGSSDLLAALGNRYEAFQELTQVLPPPAAPSGDAPSAADSDFADLFPAPPPVPDFAPPPAPVVASAPAFEPTPAPVFAAPAVPAPAVTPAPPSFAAASIASAAQTALGSLAPKKKAAKAKVPAVRPRRSLGRVVMAAAAVIVAAVASPAVWRTYHEATAVVEPATNSVTIDSNPDGSIVFVDGVEKGRTPFTTTLTVGPHSIELRYKKNSRKVDLDVTAGEPIVTNVDWLKKPAPKKKPAAAKAKDETKAATGAASTAAATPAKAADASSAPHVPNTAATAPHTPQTHAPAATPAEPAASPTPAAEPDAR